MSVLKNSNRSKVRSGVKRGGTKDHLEATGTVMEEVFWAEPEMNQSRDGIAIDMTDDYRSDSDSEMPPLSVYGTIM